MERYRGGSMDSDADVSTDEASTPDQHHFSDQKRLAHNRSHRGMMPRLCLYLCQLRGHGGLDRVREAVRADADFLEYKDRYGKTAMHYAVRANAPVDVLEGLAQRGLRVDEGDNDGWTPLHLYLRLNRNVDSAVGEYLLRLGADPKKKDLMGEDAVFKCVAMDVSSKFLLCLLQHGGDPKTSNIDDETPLIVAVKGRPYHDLENVINNITLLIARGASPLKRDKNGKNALDWGRERGNDDLVKVMRHAWYHREV